jgi:hypothetical protein
MTRRHGDSPFAVQRQSSGSLKYDACHEYLKKCTLRHFSGYSRQVNHLSKEKSMESKT